MTHYILIDAKTRAPVPLPWETILGHRQFRVTSFTDTYLIGHWTEGRRQGMNGHPNPKAVGLELITEADFMAERNDDQ